VTTPRVRLSGIVRRFGAVTALDGASLELRAGEVHGVLGENGAGKTTLLNILGGMLAPDAGTVEVDGERVVMSTPRDAWRHGIGMVHQHFKLVAQLTVLENLSLGMRSARGGLGLPFRRVRRGVADLEERTGLRLDLEARVSELGVGERQRVEIVKALLREPGVLVLDEPTAVLTPDEVDALFGLLGSLADEGRAVALVAHKLDEVMAVSHRYTVLRSGRTVLTGARGEVDAPELVAAMVGGAPQREVSPGNDRRHVADRSEAVASLEGVGVRTDRGWAVRGASLDVRRGEIVGIAGVEGNGQRELALVLSGRLEPDEGRAVLPGGIGFVPQDRTTEGLIADFDMAENIGLALHDRWPGPGGGHAGGGRWLMPWAEARSRAEDVRRRFGVKAPSVRTRAGALSGGNQQRLVVGRELAMATDLLVAENPTRGLDIAATRFVRARLQMPPVPAPGVVLISSDLDEVLALADRVLVMVRGRLVAVSEQSRTREGVGELMLGGGAGR
jgi:general nucleoside transport system ATP-binding protein